MAGIVHIAGAGLAGLSTALWLAKSGVAVRVYEAAGQAGGRCRSYFDETLGCEIDNGNHLLMSGNSSAMRYLDLVGARETLLCPPVAEYPFVDLGTGQRWTLRPNAGPLPWWIASKARRVPDTRAAQYLTGARLAMAGGELTVADLFGRHETLYRRFWEPLAVAALNTAPEEAAAKLLWPVMKETLGKGEAASRPCIARTGLSDSFVKPALAFLEAAGVSVAFNRRLREIGFEGERVASLSFGKETIDIGPRDRVVLAVTPGVAADLLPGMDLPTEARPIVNAHFLLDAPLDMPGRAPILGIVGGTAQWLFAREKIASVTISAAEAEVDRPAEELAPVIWGDICRALDLGEAPMPKWRIVKEKRATFAHTPYQVAKRPGTRTKWKNLYLAGDWTDTGLPATIEGAIRSGEWAARAAAAG